MLLALNELAVIISAPASIYSLCISPIVSGLVRLNDSLLPEGPCAEASCPSLQDEDSLGKFGPDVVHTVAIFLNLKTFPQDSDDVGGLAHRVEVNTGNSVSQKVFALSGGPFRPI